MRKDELRPCIIKIGDETETIQFINNESKTKVIKKGEIYKGYFHRWVDEGASSGCESFMKCYAIVEYEDGVVHKIDPECITFTDRDCKE